MAEPYLGEIKIFGFGFAPRGYALCNGQVMPVQQNQALFALLGVRYGGNGSTTFALPNLAGRTPIAQAPAQGVSIGSQGGVETVTLTEAQIPPHTHGLNGTTATATARAPLNGLFANDTAPGTDFLAAAGNLVALDPRTVSAGGPGGGHDNMQPFLTVNVCIAVQGIFPSRN